MRKNPRSQDVGQYHTKIDVLNGYETSWAEELIFFMSFLGYYRLSFYIDGFNCINSNPVYTRDESVVADASCLVHVLFELLRMLHELLKVKQVQTLTPAQNRQLRMRIHLVCVCIWVCGCRYVNSSLRLLGDGGRSGRSDRTRSKMLTCCNDQCFNKSIKLYIWTCQIRRTMICVWNNNNNNNNSNNNNNNNNNNENNNNICKTCSQFRFSLFQPQFFHKRFGRNRRKTQ